MPDDDLAVRVGERIRELRRRRGMTLTDLARTTGCSISVLSRLEAGKRRPTLELLMALAAAYRVQLDDLVGAPTTGDPRLHLRPMTYRGRTIVPLTHHPGPMQAYKQVLPGDTARDEPERQVHDGHEWLYVLSGRLRLLVAERDVVLGPGAVAEFDTHLPHWIGSADGRPVEILSLFGPQGERVHVTAPHPPTGGTETGATFEDPA